MYVVKNKRKPLTFSCFCFSLSRTDRELLTFFKSSTSTVTERKQLLVQIANFEVT